MDNELNPNECNPNETQPVDAQPNEAMPIEAQPPGPPPPAAEPYGAQSPWPSPPGAQPYMQPPYGQQQSYPPYPYAAQPKHPYKDLGGWLLFFVVVAILGDVSSFFSLIGKNGLPAALVSGDWLSILTQLVSLAILALSVVWIVMIFRRDPRFFRIWQLERLASFISMPFAIGTMAFAFAGDGFTAAFSEIFDQFGMDAAEIVPFIKVGILVGGVLGLLLFILFFFLMTHYYKSSVRVRTYMGSDQYLRLAAFTKKANPQPAVPDEQNYNKQEAPYADLP